MTDTITIFDTTLRDGEQSPGASMTIDEKIMIAEMLDQAGIDVIEAGFPVTSEGDFNAVKEISRRLKNAVVCGLARAKDMDIERAAEAMKDADRFRIHTFISTSPLHMEYKLKMSPENVLEAIEKSVSKAKKYTPDVEWSCEDGTRTEKDFLYRAIEIAIKSGATTINVPDTVGYTTPDEYYKIITDIRNNVPNIDQAILSAHCHNDLGLAVANSLSALSAGARQIECTINGLGERAGNAAIEEIVMALKTRPDLYNLSSNVDTKQFMHLSRTVSTVTGFPVQYNKAIVGKNAFAHESGIHQDGMLKNAQTYEIMRPEDVGLVKTDLVLGKLSGRHAFTQKLKDMGIGHNLSDEAVNDLFKRFKDLADRKKQVYDDDILMLVAQENIDNQDMSINFNELTIICGSEGPQRAIVSLIIDNQEHEFTARGDGPVDAIFKGIHALYPHKATLELYQVHAVTEGTDAQARVTVRLSEEDFTATGVAAHTDTMTASAKAYINALNRLFIRKKRSK